MLCSCTSLQSHSHVTFAQVTKHPKQWAGGREIRGKCSNANYTTLVVVYRVCSSFCRPAAACWRWKHIHLFGACQYAWPVSLILLYMTFVIVFSFLGCELLWRGSRIEHTGPGSEWHLQKLGPWSWVQSWCKHKTAVYCTHPMNRLNWYSTEKALEICHRLLCTNPFRSTVTWTSAAPPPPAVIRSDVEPSNHLVCLDLLSPHSFIVATLQDSIFAPRNFENLGYQFLTSPKAKEVVWQASLPAICSTWEDWHLLLGVASSLSRSRRPKCSKLQSYRSRDRHLCTTTTSWTSVHSMCAPLASCVQSLKAGCIFQSSELCLQ